MTDRRVKREGREPAQKRGVCHLIVHVIEHGRALTSRRYLR
jgi:hypothetical protein